MIDRIIISLVAAVIAFFAVLVGAWVLIEAYRLVSWQIPLVGAISVFLALFIVDWATDELAKRQK